MTVLIIVLVAVFVVALLATVGVATRRRRAHPQPPAGGAATTTAPPRPAPHLATPAPSAPAPPRAPPEAAPEAPVEVVPVEEVAEAVPDVAEAVEAPVGVVPEPATFRSRLGKARGLFAGVVGTVRGRRAIEQSTWDDLEEAMLRADVGVATTDALLDRLRERVKAKEITDGAALIDGLRDELVSVLDSVGDNGAADRTLHFDGDADATDVWLFVGVNGVGKTTTVGKVARQQSAGGRSVLLAAGDTFRAAAAEQLSMWGERVGAEVVRGAEGGDPSAVVFDAVQRASARGNDLVLADTAGRLHTKVNLVEELKKIRRVADRDPGHVSEVLLVLDATTGQNGLTQARQFLDAVGVTGVVLTKLDGSAKGGIVIAIQRELGLPVKLVGLGEGPDDLVPFDADEFVDALFD
jgi:fused signal recognition particle receptor